MADLQKLIERLNRQYSKELGKCELYLAEWNNPDTCYRVKITPSNLKDGSWESDLGPAFKDKSECEAFLRGLEFAGDIERKAQF